MREDDKENNLFYTCSLIEYISRYTKNKKCDVIKKLGKNNIEKILELSDVYHCENIQEVAYSFIERCHINNGEYDLDKFKDKPSYFDMGRVYQRLILMVNKRDTRYVDTLMEVFNSFIIEKLDNYGSSLYYENPSYIYSCYISGKIL